MSRRARAFLAAAVVSALAAVLVLPAGATTTITVDPAVGTPDDAFHVELPALYRVRQIKDRYFFVVSGPGGGNCDGSVTEKVGITPPRGDSTVSVDLPGVRSASGGIVVEGPWCLGHFLGRVEFRDYVPLRHGRHKTVTHRIGTFTFEVRNSP